MGRFVSCFDGWYWPCWLFENRWVSLMFVDFIGTLGSAFANCWAVLWSWCVPSALTAVIAGPLIMSIYNMNWPSAKHCPIIFVPNPCILICPNLPLRGKMSFPAKYFLAVSFVFRAVSIFGLCPLRENSQGKHLCFKHKNRWKGLSYCSDWMLIKFLWISFPPFFPVLLAG